MEDNYEGTPDSSKRGRSLFWPILLIGAGVIWLLVATGAIAENSLINLASFWPMLLVVLGIELLFGHNRPLIGLILGILVIAAVLIGLLVLPAPREGTALSSTIFGNWQQLKHEELSVPMDDIAEAHIDLDLSEWPTEIEALDDSETLMRGSLDYRGTLIWNSETDVDKMNIVLDHNQSFSLGSLTERDARWHFDINKEIPFELVLDAGSGPIAADLSETALTSLMLDAGSGPTSLSLPANLTATLDGSTGTLQVAIPEGGNQRLTLDGGSGGYTLTIDEPADIELDLETHSGAGYVELASGSSGNITLNGHSGSTTLELRGDPGIRLTIVDRSSGSIQLPTRMHQVIAGNDEGEGTWESDNYESADYRISISAELGSGAFILR